MLKANNGTSVYCSIIRYDPTRGRINQSKHCEREIAIIHFAQGAYKYNTLYCKGIPHDKLLSIALHMNSFKRPSDNNYYAVHCVSSKSKRVNNYVLKMWAFNRPIKQNKYFKLTLFYLHIHNTQSLHCLQYDEELFLHTSQNVLLSIMAFVLLFLHGNSMESMLSVFWLSYNIDTTYWILI